MEGLGGGYSFGQSDLDFPPADGQLSSAVSSIPSLPALHLGYPHIQHGGAPHRESAFTAHGRLPPGGDMYALPRFPVVPDVGIRTGGPNFNHLLTRQLSHSPPLPLPHISSFSDPSASYISHTGDRATGSISHAAENLSDHPSFGSIMASAASNISTMNIPHPYNMNSQSSGIQSRADLNTTYSGGSADSSEFLNNFNTIPVSEASEVLSQSPEPLQSTSGLNSFPSTHSSPPASQAIFMGSRVHSASSSSRSIQPDHLTNAAGCQSRVLHNVPMENLDGDQQVPNAVMSPSSNCSSPSLRNTSTPDNRHMGNLLRQAVNNDSIANQTIQNDNMANLRNEQSFANATLIGSELCNSKFIPSLQNVSKSTPQPNFSSNLLTTENRHSEDRNNNMRSFQKEKSNESVKENHNEAGLSRHNVSDNVTMNHSRSATNVCVNSENRTVASVVRKMSPKVKKKLNLEVDSNSSLNRFHCPNVMSTKQSRQNDKNNVTFLKMGNLANQKSRLSMEISSNILNFMTQFSNKLLSKENLPACLEYEIDFARMEQEVASKLMNMRNGLSNSFLPYQTQDDEDGIVNYCDSVDNGNGCFDNYNQGEDEQSSKRRKNRRPSYIQQSNEESDIDEHEEDPGRFPVKSEGDMQESIIDFPSDELSPDAKRINNRFRPFAITSPSFARSAAPAVMTTTVSDNATMVTISIKGKASLHRTKTKTININQGGLMSTGSICKSQQGGEDEEEEYAESEEEEGEEGGYSLGVQKTSIMSKLHREKDEVKDGASCDGEDLVEKMEVNIRIEDSQLVQHGEQKRWQCHVCTKSYTTKHNLVTHILDHNGIKPHLCMMCGKYFKQLSHLNTHMLTHDNIRPHKCTICGKGFTQISHLKRHQAVHLDSKPYICDICNRGFAYPSELKSHKEKHAQGTKDKCEECDVEFDSPRALKLHLLKHENRQDLICKYCDKAFRYPSQLKDHLVSHEGSRPYICTECGMDFMKEHHLKAHQFTHTGQRPYNCPKCGRAFNQRANMMRHMLIHNPTRAFQCDICGKKFTQPQTLKAHKVVHAETKPHKCKVCGKQFGRLHNLQGHMHMHNNTKPYICFCGSSFTLKGNLNRHKKVKHGLNESTESLEEQAVSFLSSLSGRTLQEIDDTDDNDYDQELTASSSESRSHRKGRKSIPRKIMRRHRSASGKLENFEVSDEEDEEEDSHGGRNDANVSRYFRALNEVEPEKCARDESAAESYHRSEKQIKAKKSLRKRRAPKRISLTEDTYDEYSEDSEGQGQSAGKENEDISDSESLLKRTRLSGGKGEKLDSIIAEKFKNF